MYAELETARKSKLLVYVTGDRPGMETQISSDVYDKFVNHLDLIGVMEKIISFLCSESGRHDYTIRRREARNGLGLIVQKPDDELYALVKRIYDDIVQELCLDTKFDVGNALGGQPQAAYSCRRALIDSVPGGTDFFISEGTLAQQTIQVQPGVTQVAIEDRRTFEGGRHEN